MILVITLDDRDGVAFNRRRQSRDRLLCEDLVRMAKGRTLYMSPYSAPLFADLAEASICATADFALQAGTDDICFLELEAPGAYIAQATELVIYRWNRHYPSDVKAELNMSAWHLASREEFVGSSHEKITKEMYVK